MLLEQEVDLSPFLSFANEVVCKSLYRIESIHDLKSYFSSNQNGNYQILGGGSNVLFATERTEKDILHISFQGIEVKSKYDQYDLVEVQAGENWHEFVLWSIENDYGGIENLSLIPGTVGAAPIQNIGAYGVEIKDVLHAVKVYEIASGKCFTLHKTECDFRYRDSIFKSKHKGKFVILSILLKLSKSEHTIEKSYGAIQSELNNRGIDSPSPQDISDIVIGIRRNKLPDPKEFGNGGSFFKNPIVDTESLKQIQSKYENVPNYPQDDGGIKLAAGWLIEKAGWKGKRIGNVGCHANQALVIVNYGGATGLEIWTHAEQVQASVFNQFGIKLIPEVNLIQA